MGNTVSIRQLVYASYQAVPFDGLSLVALLYQARDKNKLLNITGVLLQSHALFVQCLEGSSADVEALFARIAVDPRHRDVVLLQSIEVPERHFSQWSMASAKIDDLQGLELVRAEWESELSRIENDQSFSPGFVLMKSIWDNLREYGNVDLG